MERLAVKNCFVILYAGNLGRLQGLDELIDAAALLRESLPSLRIVLVGDGVEKERLQAKVLALGLDHVQFVGRLPQTEIPAYAALADALYVGLVAGVLAGLSVPSKVPAYLACGRPILSNVPGETAALIEQHQLGVNCPSPEAQGIAEGIRYMAGVPAAERGEMGRRARALFLVNFAIAPLLEQHEAVFISTLTAYRTRDNTP
jgi:glycosyltransferase involved in cell wall biosynthesis